VEILFELLFEVVGQLLVELVFDLGFRRVGRLLSNRYVRAGLGVGLGTALAYGGGRWWGNRLLEAGRTELPTTFYVSIGLAVAFGVLALVRAIKGPRDDSIRVGLGDVLDEPAESVRLLSPVHWSAWRLVTFAAINVALALGVNAGFNPDVVL
jgi:hypothetical protein